MSAVFTNYIIPHNCTRIIKAAMDRGFQPNKNFSLLYRDSNGWWPLTDVVKDISRQVPDETVEMIWENWSESDKYSYVEYFRNGQRICCGTRIDKPV